MRLVSTLGAIFMGLGCQGPLQNYPPVDGCPVGAGSCIRGGGSTMGTGGSSTTTTTGAGGSTDQPGTVGIITSPLFTSEALVQFTGPATIEDLPSVGGTFTAPFGTALGAGGATGAGGGGASSTSFDLLNVPAGPSWLLVQDLSNGASGIYSTFSQATLPILPSLTLPVLEQSVLTNIASNLPSVTARGGVSTLAAHVVLVLTLNNAPAAGISVTGGAGGAEVVYDIGPGTFSDSATATGSGGTIILFNAGLQGPDTITLLNATTMTAYSVAVETGQGVVTLASISLD